MTDFPGNDQPNLIRGDNNGDTIEGYGGNDQLFGGTGDDTIDGGRDHDLISGGLGHDVLIGGPGSDIYQDTVAGLNGDEITDMKIGDRIQITDLPTYNSDGSDNAHIGITGDTLTFNGGSVTIDNIGPGRYVTRAIGNAGTEIRLQEDAHNDFNGDGYSDMLLRDTATGNWVTEWSGGHDGVLTNNGANSTLFFDPSWTIAGTGDFNGDGRVDFMLQNPDGWVTDWLGNSNGSFSNNGANASLHFASNWQIAGVGDFNGDGNSDFLLRDTTGGWLTEWLGTSTGGFTNNGANATEYFTNDWKVIGTGDFNGDGTDDFLLQNSAGWVTDWLGDPNGSGSFTNNGANCSILFQSDWHVIATGDFNGDGISDMLLRSDAGWVTDWLGTSTGGFTNNGANTSLFFTSDWQIAGVGDLNGDSIDDILLRNPNNGWTTDWLGTTAGSFTNNGDHFSTNIATNWHVQDPFM